MTAHLKRSTGRCGTHGPERACGPAALSPIDWLHLSMEMQTEVDTAECG